MCGFDTEYVPGGSGGNRILSYQLYAICGDQSWWTIVFPSLGERLSFKRLVALIVQEGIKAGYITRWPKTVYAAAHWTRADLPAFADFKKLKSEFDSVQNTYVTTTKPLHVSLSIGGHHREFSIYLLDTMLLSPGRSSLADLGQLYGLEKVDPGEKLVSDPMGGPPLRIKYIERMDLLLEEDPELYRRYALRDAEICARHADAMIAFMRYEIGTTAILPTLGVIAVHYLLKVWKERDIDPGAVLGYEIVSEPVFNRQQRRYRTIHRKRWHALYEDHKGLAVDAYHGGRNECFFFGPTPVGNWFEHDLTSAYPTALTGIGMPDYGRAFTTTDVHDFTGNVLAFARVRFRFPDGTQSPCLAVDAPGGRGLIYALEGETAATGREIELAVRMSATIEILYGVVVPWCADAPRPFEVVVKDILRRRSEHAKNTLQNELWKQIANSIYGKLGQGVHERKAYNARTSQRDRIPRSKITCSYLAGYVTGFLRAVMSELVAGMPRHRTVISATTDALLTDAPLHELSCRDPGMFVFRRSARANYRQA